MWVLDLSSAHLFCLSHMGEKACWGHHASKKWFVQGILNNFSCPPVVVHNYCFHNDMRYTAAFMYVLSTPYSVKMVHQDDHLSTVNNKRVVPISSYLPSHMGCWQDRKKAIKSNCSLFICKSVHFFLEKCCWTFICVNDLLHLFSCTLLK